jgi:hypothetical protein
MEQEGKLRLGKAEGEPQQAELSSHLGRCIQWSS